MVYAPLARYLTNVAHLIVCPDGQLNCLPFEMLSVGNKFLVEEETISYLTSGREVVRLQNHSRKNDFATNDFAKTAEAKSLMAKSSGAAHGRSLVMGNPEFDPDLRSSRGESALTRTSQPSTNNSQPGIGTVGLRSAEYRLGSLNPNADFEPLFCATLATLSVN